jgi:hypothetical protein
MPHLTLTLAARDAYRALQKMPAGDGSRRRVTDGLYDIPVTQKALDILNAIREQGESDSDVVLRLARTIRQDELGRFPRPGTRTTVYPVTRRINTWSGR